MTSKNTVDNFIGTYINLISNEGYRLESWNDDKAVLVKRFQRGVIGDCLRFSETSFEHRFVVTPDSTYKDFIDSERRLILTEFKEILPRLKSCIDDLELQDTTQWHTL